MILYLFQDYLKEKASNRDLFALVEILELSYLSLSDGVYRKTLEIMVATMHSKPPDHAHSSFQAVRPTSVNFCLLTINTEFNTQNEECISIHLTICIILPAYLCVHHCNKNIHLINVKIHKNSIHNLGQCVANFGTYLQNEMAMKSISPTNKQLLIFKDCFGLLALALPGKDLEEVL